MGFADWPKVSKGSITEQHARLFIKAHPPTKRGTNLYDLSNSLATAVEYMEELVAELERKRGR